MLDLSKLAQSQSRNLRAKKRQNYTFTTVKDKK